MISLTYENPFYYQAVIMHLSLAVLHMPSKTLIWHSLHVSQSTLHDCHTFKRYRYTHTHTNKM